MSVLSSDVNYWISNKEQWREVIEMFDANRGILEQEEIAKSIKNRLFDSFDKFKAINM